MTAEIQPAKFIDPLHETASMRPRSNDRGNADAPEAGRILAEVLQ